MGVGRTSFRGVAPGWLLRPLVGILKHSF